MPCCTVYCIDTVNFKISGFIELARCWETELRVLLAKKLKKTLPIGRARDEPGFLIAWQGHHPLAKASSEQFLDFFVGGSPPTFSLGSLTGFIFGRWSMHR